MMGRVHEVGIAADAKAFDQGIRSGVIKPLGDAEKALDELGKSRGPEQLERDLKTAQRETEELADDTKATARQIDQSYKDAGRDIKRNVSDGLKDSAREAKSSGKEAAASFSGEFSDVGDFMQETLANAFEGFGPIGAAAGLAAAVGLGVVTAEVEKQNEAAQKLKEYFADAYKTAASEGQNYIDTATIIAEAQSIIFDPDRANEYNQAQKDAEQIGLDVNTVVRARAGDQEALNVVLQATADKEAEIKAKAEEAGSTAIRMSLDERNALDRIASRYEDIGELHTTNAENLQRAQDIANGIHQEERDQINRTADASQKRYEAMAAKAANPITVPVEFVPDDSKVRNWRPPIIQIQARIQMPAGSKQLIQ